MFNNINRNIITSNRDTDTCNMIKQKIKECIKKETLDLVKVDQDFISASFENNKVTELKVDGEIFNFDPWYTWNLEDIKKDIIVSEDLKFAFHSWQLVDLGDAYMIDMSSLEDEFNGVVINFNKDDILIAGKASAEIQNVQYIMTSNNKIGIFKKSEDVYGIGARIINISETAREIARYSAILAGDQYEVKTLGIVLDRAIGIDKRGRGVKLIQAFDDTTLEPLPLLFEVTIERVEGYNKFEVYGIGRARDTSEFDKIISPWEISKDVISKIDGHVLELAFKFLSKEFKEFVEKMFGHNILEYAAFIEKNGTTGMVVPTNTENTKTDEKIIYTKMGVNKPTKWDAMQMLYKQGYKIIGG